MNWKRLLIVERMVLSNFEDTCSPGKNKVLHSFRAYSVVFPIMLILLFLEAIFILASIPSGELGSSLTIKGSLPKLPS
jgi:hypothetical protein